MNPRSKPVKVTKFGPSLTIPGQALKPAELLKRHLAGTLPDIDLSKKYEYHYDEHGNQVAEPLPVEMHEMYKLSVAIRQKQYEEALEHRKREAEKHKEEIIAEYERTRNVKVLDESHSEVPPKVVGSKKPTTPKGEKTVKTPGTSSPS